MNGYIDNIITIVGFILLIYIWVKSRKIIKSLDRTHKKLEKCIESLSTNNPTKTEKGR